MKVNEKLSVLFLLEKSRSNDDGLVPVTVRLTINGQRADFFLGNLVDPNFWDQKANRVINKGHPDAKQAGSVNNAITKCLAQLKTDYDRKRNFIIFYFLLSLSFIYFLHGSIVRIKKTPSNILFHSALELLSVSLVTIPPDI